MTPHRRIEGFTLIEVLIGTTVLAIMMTLLTSALFTMTRSARAGETRMQEIDSAQLAGAFLRRQLQNAVPLTERGDDGEPHVLFEGRGDSLRFVAHLPLVEGGGLQFLELAATNDGLSIRYRDAWPDIPFEGASGAWHSRTLLPDVRRARWRYFGAHDDETPGRWSDDWVRADRLPELVRVELKRSDDSVTALAAEVRVRSAVAQVALYREPPEDAR
jgi:prepilin-type N-terminal cleavage/methylation domain-containing protein